MSCSRFKNLYRHNKKNKISMKTKHNISACLICGEQGQHDIFITDYSNYLHSSGTQLAKFLTKIIGEEPCYSVSQLVCENCYYYLDRLDTYQARSAELSNYVSSRYKATKVELLGNRQRISELIESSLSNIKSFKNGTTLNVCDELSVTVFHESLQRGESRTQASSSAENHLISNSNTSSFKSNINNNENNYVKFKRKRKTSTSQANLIKKQKGTTTLNNYNINNNNNNIVENNIYNYCNGLESEPSPINSVHKNGATSESESEQSVKESEFHDSDNSQQSTMSKRKNCTNNKNSSNTSNNSRSASSSSGGSSSSTNSSSSNSNASSSSSDSNNNSSTSDESSDEEANVGDKTKAIKENEVAEPKAQEQESICEVKKEINGDEDLFKAKLDLQNISGKEDMGVFESHIAEAVLAQSSLATNILQSFLSTSLWMNSASDSINRSSFANLTKPQQKQVQTLQAQCRDDDMTESLNTSAALSINDKKKRLELKNTGQSYVNTKGKLIEAKRVWPQDCTRCPLKCNGRLSEETRLVIFSEYWGLGDYDLQREYLAVHMEREERVGPSGHTRTVVLYFLTFDNDRYQVCRQFFLKTLDVSEKASRIVLEKKLKGELGVEAPPLPPTTGDDSITNN